MAAGALGKEYQNGETIIQQGEGGDCMYVIQTGEVEVVLGDGENETVLAVLEKGDFFGEMALFERQPRSATVRARGAARVLTIDKRTFLRRIHHDPSLAFRIVQELCHRIRELDTELTKARRAT